MIKPFAFLALAAFPLALGAQSPSAGVGYWVTSGGRQGEAAAHGIRAQGALAVTLAGVTTDLEAAFSQAIFSRTFAAGKSRVNENSLEFVPLAHLRRGDDSWWPYAGPVLSVGIGCGTAGTNDPNGLVACNPNGSRSEGSVKLGLAAGIAVKRPMGSHAVSAEFRAQANTISSARGSGPVLLIAVGIRGR